MDFRRPLRLVSPTLDGDVLAALSRADVALTPPRVHQLIGHGSVDGVRRALERLVRQGIVVRTRGGNAHLYGLNRAHLAARWIEGLAGLWRELIERLQTLIESWTIRPVAAVLFGSAGRSEAGPESDLDLLVIRPAGCDADDAVWREQLETLAFSATAWTGNDARVLEYGETELDGGEPVLEEAFREGIELAGSLRALRRALRRTAK